MQTEMDVLKEGQGEMRVAEQKVQMKVEVEVEVEAEEEEEADADEAGAEEPIAEKVMGKIDRQEARWFQF